MPDAQPPDLIVRSEAPYNAETPLHRLRRSFLTGVGDFFVRSHGDVPRAEPATHRLRVAGRVSCPLNLTVAELRARFPARTLQAVLQCAGNRRSELAAVRPVSGNPWASGAIGNAEWTGAALADLLRAAGAEMRDGLHVAFHALDTVAGDGPFAVSIPLSKAMAPETLLAWAMNGAPLVAAHGAPLRAVVPGWAGIRSAKWVATVEVRDDPADGPLQRRDYKHLPPGACADTTDWDAAPPINEMPLNAAICEPAPGACLLPGSCALRGYAVAAGRGVLRVDVSADGGASWTEAVVERPADAPWSWVFWHATLDLAPGTRELAVRAWDGAGLTQPTRAEDVWNFKGYLCNAWHRVTVRVG